MKTMKAAQLVHYGGPDAIIYGDLQVPKPLPNEVLVKIHAAAVNGLDWKIRDGELQKLFSFNLPIVLGSDGAGTVAAIGEGVKDFVIGQEVYGSMNRSRSGSFAEFAIADTNALALKPPSLNFIEAASIPAVAITAWQALFDKGKLSKGQKVLIHGASGGVGSFAVQLARIKGAYVYATSSAANAESVRKLGADEVIDYNQQLFEDIVKDADLILDILGGETRDRSWQVLKQGGTLITTVPPPPRPPDGLKAEIVMMQPNAHQLKFITDLIEQGNLITTIDRTFPLSDANSAMEFNKAGHTRGKICIKVI